MPDLIADGAVWLADQRKTHLAREIEYVTGATSVTVQATIGRTDFELVGEGGIMERTESRDFIVATGDLTAAPSRGDQIRETVGPTVYVFEVMAPVASAPPWRWADAARTAYRIHTRLVGTEQTHVPPADPPEPPEPTP